MKSDGWKSRKLWMTLLAMALMVYGFILCGKPADRYGEFCMGILAAAGLFKAANVIEKIKTQPPAS